MTARQIPRHGTEGDIKDRESRLGATRSPRFPTLDGRPRHPILPFWQLWIQFGMSPRRVALRSLKAKFMGVFIRLLVDGMWNNGSDLQAGAEINIIGDTLDFGSFWVTKMTPFWEPNFTPPCGQLAVPYIYASGRTGPYLKSCTW